MQRLVAAIVHFGPIEPTLATVASLRSADPATEIWVVDNQGLEEGERRTASRAGVDRWLLPGENLGYGRAINLAAAEALRRASHDAVLALNNDVELDPGAVGRLASALFAEPRIGASAPRILLAGTPPRIWYDGGEIDWLRGTARVPAAGSRLADLEADGATREVDFVTGCALLLRLDALAAVGGFDPRYFLYEEDVELSLRLREAGWRLRQVPAALARHRGQASQRAGGEPFLPIHHPRHPRLERLIELRVSNRLLTAERHAHGLTRLRFHLGSSSYWLAKCLQATAAGSPGAFAAWRRGVARYRRLRRLPGVDAGLTDGSLAAR